MSVSVPEPVFVSASVPLPSVRMALYDVFVLSLPTVMTDVVLAAPL